MQQETELATTGEVSATWTIQPVIEQLADHLEVSQIEMLVLLGEVLNDRDGSIALDALPEWQNQPHVDLRTPWPE